MARDIDVTSALLSAFFESRRVRQSLTRIHEVGISGSEKWWQTEFALYLSDHEDIAE
jgi:hypothetical protein